MSKHIVSFVIGLSIAIVFVAFASEANAQQAATYAAPAYANGATYAAPTYTTPSFVYRPSVAPSYNYAVPTTRPRLDLGFDGIPFNGSHLAALRRNRAIRTGWYGY